MNTNEIDFNTKYFNEVIDEIKEWDEAGWRITYTEISECEDDGSWDVHIECYLNKNI